MKAVLWRLENRLGVTGRAALRRRWRQIKRLCYPFSAVLLSADAKLLAVNKSTFEPNKRTGSRVQLKEGETKNTLSVSTFVRAKGSMLSAKV